MGTSFLFSASMSSFGLGGGDSGGCCRCGDGNTMLFVMNLSIESLVKGGIRKATLATFLSDC